MYNSGDSAEYWNADDYILGLITVERSMCWCLQSSLL